MTDLNFKDFLTTGAFLQIGPDLFKLLVGPFSPIKQATTEVLLSKTLFYRPNFWDFLNESQNNAQNFVYFGTQEFTLNREDFIHLLNQHKALLPNCNWNLTEERLFAEQFDWSQKEFSKGHLIKTVPIILQNANLRISFENKIWCLKHLLSFNNFGWSYGYFENESGLLGHTPEILVNWNRKDFKFKTMALAGTYPKSKLAFTEILQDKKILKEHQIVVDDISEKLKNINFSKESTQVLELRYLLHLKTEFEARVSLQEEVMQIVKRMHPTAAMGIYPNSLIKLTEFSKFKLQQERGLFAAPFCFFDSEKVHATVSIRNIIFNEKQISIFSGCGITIESEYHKEIEELENKRNSVKKMLGLVDDQF